jgi:hypothetical protein
MTPPGCPLAMPPSAAERKKLHISLKNLNGRHRFRKAMLTSKVYGAAVGITVHKRLATSQARMKLRRAIWLCLLFLSCIIGHVLAFCLIELDQGHGYPSAAMMELHRQHPLISQKVLLLCSTCTTNTLYMCWLLGMNCARPTDFTFSFKGFAQRGGITYNHSDGWGLAFSRKEIVFNNLELK